MTLLVAPVFDNVTTYCIVWADNIKSLLTNLTVIEGRKVTRAEVEDALVDKKLFIFYDHGNETGLFGSNTEQVANSNNIDKLPLSVYTMACLSAKIYGVDVWRSGRVFWGYYDVFSFTTDSLPEFEQFANSGITLISQGKSWSEAYDSTISLGNDLAKGLSDSGKYIASVAMSNNTSALRLYDSTHAPKETQCTFRRIALALFGAKGWNLRRLGKRATLD